MTIPSTARKAGPLLGTGAQTAWPFTFKVFATADVAVTIADSLGAETALVLDTDYSVTLNANQETSPGGTVTYPISGSPLAVGSKLSIIGDLDYDQPLDLPSGGNFSPLALENQLDRTIMQVQQLEETASRALLVPVTSSASSTLPNPEPNALIGWDSTGDTLANYTLAELATGIAYGTMRFDTFVGDGTTTQFALTEDPAALANLDVSIAGVTQVPGTDYTLTSATLVFTTAPVNGVAILARYGRALPISGPVDSSAVTHVATGAGAVARTAQAKLRESVSVKDFGAVGDGVADDTVAIQAAFNYAFPLALPVVFKGSYLVSGTLLSFAVRPVGSLHIICDGKVNITVDASSTAFDHLIYGRATASNNGSITGGELVINCSNKVGSAITFRHADASQSGTVSVTCPVTILNCLNNNAADVNANYGLAVTGNYKNVILNNITVDGVARTNPSAGSCQGISGFGISGNAVINNPVISNVLTPSSIDADGISWFGLKTGVATFANYNGTVTINEPIITDCEVRSIKLAIGNATVFRPRIFRKLVVSAGNSSDFDFQSGGQSLLIEPYFEYKKNGGVSPLSVSHNPVVFQNKNSEEDSTAKSIGGVMRSEVDMRRYAFVNSDSTSLNTNTIVDGIVAEPIGGLATGIFIYGIAEFDVAPIEAGTSKHTVIVKNCIAPITNYALTYNSGTGASLAGKCFVEAYNNVNTLNSNKKTISQISGSQVNTWGSFRLFNNPGFINLMPGALAIDFATLVIGNAFTVQLASVVATAAPAWTVTPTEVALIEVLGKSAVGGNQVRVTVGNAAAAGTVFYTGSSGVTWGTIK